MKVDEIASGELFGSFVRFFLAIQQMLETFHQFCHILLQRSVAILSHSSSTVVGGHCICGRLLA